jgi:hypothetical protein
VEARFLAALERTQAFTEDDLEQLKLFEDEQGPIANWPPLTFEDLFTGEIAKAIVARQAVSDAKVGLAPEASRETVLPEFPPYLSKLEDYNPSDPSQFWTDPATGELWRWDGKGRSPQVQVRGLPFGAPKQLSELPIYKNGEPHRVVQVPHITVNGLRIPTLQGMQDANAQEYDWFHHGYGVWIGHGGKPYGEVDMQLRQRVLNALNALPNNQPLIRRPLRSA